MSKPFQDCEDDEPDLCDILAGDARCTPCRDGNHPACVGMVDDVLCYCSVCEETDEGGGGLMARVSNIDKDTFYRINPKFQKFLDNVIVRLVVHDDRFSHVLDMAIKVAMEEWDRK